MDVPSSRILLSPADSDGSSRFYRDVPGLGIYREFGPADDPSCTGSAIGTSRISTSQYRANLCQTTWTGPQTKFGRPDHPAPLRDAGPTAGSADQPGALATQIARTAPTSPAVRRGC